MRRVIMWRHGRTGWNAERRFQGQTDIHLDEVGHGQAARAAQMLAWMSPVAIVSSDLTRAQQTAAPLSVACGVDVHLDSRLRETFAGQWEGLTREELGADHAEEFARWSAGDNIRPGSNGELRTEVAARVHEAVAEYAAQLPPDGTLVIVTHGGSARMGMGSLLGLPVDLWACLGLLSNCSWSVLGENPGNSRVPWRLHEYNAGTLPQPAIGDDR